jgi:predicted nucleic acid-binding protein
VNTYFDTSALAKKYVREPGSEEIINLWRAATAVFTSAVTYAEMMASLHRKRREVVVPAKTFERLLASFRDDWQSFYCIEVSGSLHPPIDRLVATYSLRGFDAIHLASAFLVFQRIPTDFVFACFDQQLLHAARREGLPTFPES